ncbi:hypothetical protein BDZ91DRAFT_518840 [Kalaharituber pfeilii]|nr:hypothetical protein BDZ91DRAFT_518840 [Kalaharituber pfeilii]
MHNSTAGPGRGLLMHPHAALTASTVACLSLRPPRRRVWASVRRPPTEADCPYAGISSVNLGLFHWTGRQFHERPAQGISFLRPPVVLQRCSVRVSAARRARPQSVPLACQRPYSHTASVCVHLAPFHAACCQPLPLSSIPSWRRRAPSRAYPPPFPTPRHRARPQRSRHAVST